MGFASGSNDTFIFVWSSEGELLHRLAGHEHFIFSVGFGDGLLVRFPLSDLEARPRTRLSKFGVRPTAFKRYEHPVLPGLSKFSSPVTWSLLALMALSVFSLEQPPVSLHRMPLPTTTQLATSR